MTVQNSEIAKKVGLSAPTNPLIPVIRSVTLNAGRRPMKSAVIGHTLAPIIRPAYLATVKTQFG